MKNTWYFLLITLFALSCNRNSATPEGLTSLEMKKTAQHVRIPGTRLFIIPPPGFEVSTSFTGLQKSEKAVVQAYELDAQSAARASVYFKQIWEKEGMQITSENPLKAGKYDGRFFLFEKDKSVGGCGIEFGNGSFSVMLIAFYAHNAVQTEQELIDAFRTVYYDPDLVLDDAEASFTLDEREDGFQLANVSTGNYIYSWRGGDIEDPSVDRVIVSIWPKEKFGTLSLESAGREYMTGLESMGFQNMHIVAESATRVQSLPAHEAKIAGQAGILNVLIYQLVVAKDDRLYVLNGMVTGAPEDDPDALKEVTKFIQTLHIN